jgi:glycosidase
MGSARADSRPVRDDTESAASARRYSAAMSYPLLRLAPVLALLVASGCGGGGDSGPPPPVDTTPVAAADPGSSLPAHWQHGAFAQIYVRAYQDSNGDGIGDLRGLTSRLDYLRDLGVTGVWLMPVTRSQDRDHGYAVADYRAIEPDYGSLADYDELLREAHARGIGVIVDYVINHSAFQHPAFLNSRSGTGNAFRGWYIWQSSPPSGWSIYGGNPWHSDAGGHYFAAFWDQMPEWNLKNSAVVSWHHDNLRFWLNRGTDGFRFDAVGNLVENGPAAWERQPENYVLMNGVRQLVASYAQRYIVCEVPADPQGFAVPNACGSAFGFDFNGHVINAAKNNAASIQAVAGYFNAAQPGIATFLSNHDSFAGQRLWDQLGGNVAQYKLAAATYLLQPGTPFIYYGEEIGMAGAGALGGDPKLRTPMSWSATAAGFTSGTPFRPLSANVASNNVAAQSGDPDSILAFYKAMIGLRNTWPSIARGSYQNAVASGSMLSFQRRLGGEAVVTVINYGSGTANVALAGLPPNTLLDAVYPAGAGTLSADALGAATAAIPAQSIRVYGYRP